VTLRGLAALRQKVAPSEAPSDTGEVRAKPVPSTQKAERVLRVKAAVEAVLPQGAEVTLEWGRLFVTHPSWEVVVDPDCKVAVLTGFTRKANDQGRTDEEILEAARDYAKAMRECEAMVEVVIRAKGVE
jgi:hypothetical protein